MKQLRVALAATVALAALIVGIVVVSDKGDSSCTKPAFISNSANGKAQEAVDAYLEANPPAIKDKSATIWGIESVKSTKGGLIDAVLVVGEGLNSPFGIMFTDTPAKYHVVLTRDCAGGDWKVEVFEKVKKTV